MKSVIYTRQVLAEDDAFSQQLITANREIGKLLSQARKKIRE